MPPLIITKEEVDEAIEKLGTALERLSLPPAAPA
jgi:4-aminobutyrate aminotransferase-like enzyme